MTPADAHPLVPASAADGLVLAFILAAPLWYAFDGLRWLLRAAWRAHRRGMVRLSRCSERHPAGAWRAAR